VGLFVIQGPMEATGFGELLTGGTGMAIASAACFSGLAIVTRRYISQINPVAVNAMRLWFAVAFWLAINPWPRFSEIPKEQIFYAGIAGIAGPTLGRLALMISARHLEARVTTLATLTTPALTLVFAFVVLGDWPRSHELAGGVIMIGGISIPLLRWGRTSKGVT
jgi:drug/metabolite transporter (DMT)-like permease